MHLSLIRFKRIRSSEPCPCLSKKRRKSFYLTGGRIRAVRMNRAIRTANDDVMLLSNDKKITW